MTFTFRPAIRQATPLIIGIAGPTKSGKSYSALRLANGLAPGGKIVMLNAEGARGHQYAEKFAYLSADLEAPFRPEKYTEAVLTARELDPSVLIVDSVSHMHDGPGGMIDYHEDELDRLAGNDERKRQRSTFGAWVRPKAAENAFIYAILGLKCPVILCMRAKEKLRIVPGKDPVDLGWQPIVGDRVAFETIFTLVLPPHSKGAPDLSISDMREPFDRMIPNGKQLDESVGAALAAWAKGTATPPAPPDPMVAAAKREAVRHVQSAVEKIRGKLTDVVEDETRKGLFWLEGEWGNDTVASSSKGLIEAAEALKGEVVLLTVTRQESGKLKAIGVEALEMRQ